MIWLELCTSATGEDSDVGNGGVRSTSWMTCKKMVFDESWTDADVHYRRLFNWRLTVRSGEESLASTADRGHEF